MELQHHRTVKKKNNTKSLMSYMEPKYAIKLDIVKLGKSETYPEEKVFSGNGLYRYLYQPGEQHWDQKDKLPISSGARCV